MTGVRQPAPSARAIMAAQTSAPAAASMAAGSFLIVFCS